MDNENSTGREVFISGDKILDEIRENRKKINVVGDTCKNLSQEIEENNQHLRELNGSLKRHEERLDHHREALIPFLDSSEKETTLEDIYDIAQATQAVVSYVRWGFRILFLVVLFNVLEYFNLIEYVMNFIEFRAAVM